MRNVVSAPATRTLSMVLLAGLAITATSFERATGAAPPNGQSIFRFDTFGDEQLWTDVLRMHEVIPDVVDPLTALEVGLKVDVDALPAEVRTALANDDLDLGDP